MEADDTYHHHCNSGQCPQHNHPDGPLVDYLGNDNHNTMNENNNNNNSTHLYQCSSCQRTNAATTTTSGDRDQQKANHLAVISGSVFVKDANDNLRITCADSDNDEDGNGGGDSDLDLADHLNKNFVRNRRYTESMVRIQAMAMSDDDDYGEWGSDVNEFQIILLFLSSQLVAFLLSGAIYALMIRLLRLNKLLQLFEMVEPQSKLLGYHLICFGLF